MAGLSEYKLDYNSPLDEELQTRLQKIDACLRAKYSIHSHQTALGALDLIGLRLAMLDGDRLEYGASVPKIGILLAYFQLHLSAAVELPVQTRSSWH